MRTELKRVIEHIRAHLLAGVIEDPLPDLVLLRRSEWSDQFEKLQRNRLLIGAYRYGMLNQEGKPQYDRCADIKRRIDAYIETGNLEHLVDVANLCMVEFEEGRHPKRYFASGDDGNHTANRS